MIWYFYEYRDSSLVIVLSKDIFDYEFDSDDEWEEPADGEDIDHSDGVCSFIYFLTRIHWHPFTSGADTNIGAPTL